MMASDRPKLTQIPTEAESVPQMTAKESQESSEPSVGSPPPALTRSPTIRVLDTIFAVGVVIFAFLLASFAVRNSDFWLHLATGRAIAQGEYQFGKDPFSYVGADRTWINHSWLVQYLLYTVYSIKVEAVVVLKGLLIALTAGLLLLTRKPGSNLWFGGICVALGLLASAPRLLLQPTLLSFFFVAWTLFLLNRPFTGSRRLPILTGITFALWANCDVWFFLGPVMVAITLVAVAIQAMLPKTEDTEPAGPGPKVLLISLITGTLACMISPYHFRVWSFPVELVNSELAATLAPFRDLSSVFAGARDSYILDFSGNSGGNPVNAFAFAGLMFLCVVSFALNLFHFRWAHLALWLFFSWLGMSLGRFLPFAALTTAVFTAWNFSDVAARLEKKRISAGLVRLLTFLGNFGRILTLLFGLLLIVLTYPGWLNVTPTNPYYARRLSWDVVSDASLERAAVRLQKWREEGKIPPEVHSLILSTDLTHYCAWFAPREKTFFDIRLGFHAADAADYVKMRKSFLPRMREDQDLKGFLPQDFLKKHSISFVVLSSIPSERAQTQETLNALLQAWFTRKQGDAPEPIWNLWDIQGRTTILGFAPQDFMPVAQFKALQYDPLRLAFAADKSLIPNPESFSLPIKRELWDNFISAPPPFPPEADEAEILSQYLQVLAEKDQLHAELIATARGMLVGQPGTMMSLNADATPEMLATGVLAVRAARKAVALSPDQPDPYLYLAQAYYTSFQTIGDHKREMLICALERAVMRASLDRLQGGVPMHQTCLRLFQMHTQDNRIDMAVKYLQLARRHWQLFMYSREVRDDEERKRLEAETKRLDAITMGRFKPEDLLEKLKQNFENASSRAPNALVRAAIARRPDHGLFLESLRILKNINPESMKPFERLAWYHDLIELNLLVGEVEEAAGNVVSAEETLALMNEPGELGRYLQLRAQVSYESGLQLNMVLEQDPARKIRFLKTRTAWLLGDLDLATRIQAEDAGGAIRAMEAQQTFPLKSPPRNLGYRYSDPLIALTQELLNPSDRSLGNAFLHLYSSSLQQAVQLLNREGDFKVRLGILSLEQGDNMTALKHFEDAYKPRGVDLEYPARKIAKDYLDAIKKARK